LVVVVVRFISLQVVSIKDRSKGESVERGFIERFVSFLKVSFSSA